MRAICTLVVPDSKIVSKASQARKEHVKYISVALSHNFNLEGRRPKDGLDIPENAAPQQTFRFARGEKPHHIALLPGLEE